MTQTGHCLCGAVSFRIEGTETWTCYCHRTDCCRQTASPVTTFLGNPLVRFR
ncbi:MAG: GFA family protein [Paracoccaceae bacterium]